MSGKGSPFGRGPNHNPPNYNISNEHGSGQMEKRRWTSSIDMSGVPFKGGILQVDPIGKPLREPNPSLGPRRKNRKPGPNLVFVLTFGQLPIVCGPRGVSPRPRVTSPSAPRLGPQQFGRPLGLQHRLARNTQVRPRARDKRVGPGWQVK